MTRDCPCGSGAPYPRCCGPLHDGTARASTAEELMRSRYSAFALADAGYLWRTWHPRTRPAQVDLPTGARWTRLEILSTTGGGTDDAAGTVEFRASFTGPGGAGTMREASRFERRAGHWFYVDGDVHTGA